MSTSTIHRLLLIADTNAHAFHGEVLLGGEDAEDAGATTRGVGNAIEASVDDGGSDADSAEDGKGVSDEESDGDGSDGSDGVAFAALFADASKVSHSCFPNMLFTSKTTDGRMEYRAIRPVAAGDYLTFSYVQDLFSATAEERRATLLREKDFLCGCDRCCLPDPTRALVCSPCGGTAMLAPGAPGSPAPPRWVCSSCGEVAMAGVAAGRAVEASVCAELDAIEARAQDGDWGEIPPGDCGAIAEAAAGALGCSHHLLHRAWTLQSALARSHVNKIMSEATEAAVAGDDEAGPGDPPDPARLAGAMMLASAFALMRSAYVCECAAARCGRKDRGCARAPIPECVPTVMWAVELLAELDGGLDEDGGGGAAAAASAGGATTLAAQQLDELRAFANKYEGMTAALTPGRP